MSNSNLNGALWLSNDTKQELAVAQIELLRAIDSTGSISAAGRALGISYKTAWDRLNALNNMARQALVVRNSGGSRGGGTHLTDYGRSLIAGFDALQTRHQAFLDALGSEVRTLDDVSQFVEDSRIRSSAGNQFLGAVVQIITGAVNCEVHVRISARQSIVAVITAHSAQDLNLTVDSPVIALISPAWIILSTDTSAHSSARNRIVAPIEHVTHGAVNSEVSLDLGDGKSLTVSLTRQSAIEMHLKPGRPVCALFKASSVILIGSVAHAR